MADPAGTAAARPAAGGSEGVPTGWNTKNPAVRRILADVRELARDPSDQYAAKPTEENMFEWHFVIRGPKGTDFEGGRYHGKILLPAEYPFKPPNIVFLTPNGRWETRTKICLSMSAYHPEDWQPAWGIRTMLEALISFMPSPADGALGALDCTPDQRKRYAIESSSYSHPQMPQLMEEGSCASSVTKSKELSDAISQMRFQATTKDTPQSPASPADSANPAAGTDHLPASSETSAQAAEVATEATPVEAPQPAMVMEQAQLHTTSMTTTSVPSDWVDDVLKVASWFVLFAIFVLSYRKMLTTFAPEL